VSATPQQNQVGRRAISTAEASERFHLSRTYLKHLARTGRVEGIKPGGHDWLIYEDSLLAFLAQPRSKGREGPRKKRIKQDNRVLLSTSEAHEQYGYAQNYLLELLRSGRIKGEKFGRTWLIDEDSLLAYKQRKHPTVAESSLFKPGESPAFELSALPEPTELSSNE